MSFINKIILMRENTLWEIIRGVLTWLNIILASLFFSSLVLCVFPFIYFIDKKRHSLHYIANKWAQTINLLTPSWKFHIKGKENLAKKGEAVVYVANHQSQADILALFILDMRFRWLAKASLFKIPLFGWAMAAVGYVGVVRGSKKSGELCMQKCAEHLKQGTPMVFFPEGTRSKNGVICDFKSGAFRLAHSQNVVVVPITINGCAHMLPKGSLIPRIAHIAITVHPAISPVGISADQLMEKAKNVITEELLKTTHFPMKELT